VKISYPLVREERVNVMDKLTKEFIEKAKELELKLIEAENSNNTIQISHIVGALNAFAYVISRMRSMSVRQLANKSCDSNDEALKKMED
jgi:hypothetical protein